jgi:hypothetical protein
MRLKTTPIALTAALTLGAALSTTTAIAHGGGHGAGGHGGFGDHAFPSHAFGGYLTGSRSFAAPPPGGGSFSYALGFHQRSFPCHGCHRRTIVVGSALGFYDWAYDDYGGCSVLTAYGRRWLC